MASEHTERALRSHFPDSTDHTYDVLPCPGCGSYAVCVTPDPWGTQWVAECGDCQDGAEDGRRRYSTGATEAEAIAEWNELAAEELDALDTHRLPTVAGGETATPSVAPACPVASSPRHDTLGDVAALGLSGDLWDVGIQTSAHKDSARRHWLVSGQTRRRKVTVDAPSLERAMARLCEMAETDAVHGRLVSDREPMLSSEYDTREAR